MSKNIGHFFKRRQLLIHLFLNHRILSVEIYINHITSDVFAGEGVTKILGLSKGLISKNYRIPDILKMGVRINQIVVKRSMVILGDTL